MRKPESRGGRVLEFTEAAKVLNHSVTAEQSVLGAILAQSPVFEQLDGLLEESHFYRMDHQLIFRVCRSLWESNMTVDLVTAENALAAIGKADDCGGLAYLATLVKELPSAANVMAYARIVRDKADMRLTAAAAAEVVGAADKPGAKTVDDVLAEAEASFFAISEKRQKTSKGLVSMNRVVAAAIDQMQMQYERRMAGGTAGLSTGFVELDAHTEGLHEGDLVIVAARPSMGKTSFAMQLALQVAKSGRCPSVAVFSLEMPAEQLGFRLMSCLSSIPLQAIRSGAIEEHQWGRITECSGKLSDLPMVIDDTAGISVHEIRSRCRRTARELGGLGLIVVDYIQLIDARMQNANRNDEVSSISRHLKALAKELSVPVIALSQLNRGLENRTDKRPMMADLRDSGALEQDADVIMFLYRDEVYSKLNCKEADKGVCEVIIGKQRNGPIGTVRLAFDGQYTRFSDLLTEYSENF